MLVSRDPEAEGCQRILREIRLPARGTGKPENVPSGGPAGNRHGNRPRMIARIANDLPCP